jgi:hypothetical protein
MRLLVGGALALGVGSILFQLRFMPHRAAPPPGPPAGRILHEMHPALRRLLLAEVFTRFCDNLAREFVVLYAVLVLGASLEAVGALMALQHLTALVTYLPIGRMTRAVGLQPFVGVSFVCFALFPLALALCPGPEWLPLVFVLNGLREIGEPARKAIITTHFPEQVRARGVGLYWGLRSLCVAPAGLAGAALWWFAGPKVLLFTAFVVGAVGAGVYYAWGQAAGRAEAAKTATGSLTAPPGPQYEQETSSALPPTPSPAPGGALPPPG